MSKICGIEKFISLINDGMSIMVGGFMAVGTPEFLIDIIVEKNIKDLTIICNDAGLVNKGVGKLIVNNQVKHLISSHIGLNPVAGKLMQEGLLEVTLVPQGTLIEQIRSGGAGLGGVLTPVGIGTEVAKGKDIILVDNKEYLLEKPLRADMALVYGSVSDTIGNTIQNYTSRNFNPIIATAANIVVVGTKKVVEKGELDPDKIMVPSIFVDFVLLGGVND